MSAVTDILTTDQLHDLWSAGYTITLRLRDPFEIPAHLVPRGVSYQWNPIQPDPEVKHHASGWSPVPYSRHEGFFAPWGAPGDIQIGGLALCEKSTEAVTDLKRQAMRAAEKQVEDWAAKAGEDGLVGSVRIVSGDGTEVRERSVGDTYERPTSRTIETTVKVPKDMTQHMAAVFDERDRLENEIVQPDRTLKPGPIADKFYAAMEEDPGAPWWPTLKAIILPIAIENVRAKLKETSNGS